MANKSNPSKSKTPTNAHKPAPKSKPNAPANPAGKNAHNAAQPKIEVLPIERGATPDPNNINRHTQRGGAFLENSLRKRGAFRSIASAGKGVKTPVVMAGNYTLEKAVVAGFREIINVHVTGDQLVNVVRDDLDPTSAEAIALGLEDNEIGKQSYNPDLDILAAVMADPAMQTLKDQDQILAGIIEGMGTPADDIDPSEANPRQSLAQRFGVPPFSVLDARQGYWQDRKRAWIALGIKGELGRGENVGKDGALYDSKNFGDPLQRKLSYGKGNGLLGFSEQARSHYGQAFGSGKPKDLAAAYKSQGKLRALQNSKGNAFAGGGKMPARDYSEGERGEGAQNGTSVFDPVLCELVYKWFNVDNGAILDPFAGEATKGIVAEYLGYPYTGVELRQEQVDVNYLQAKEVGVSPKWICADSEKINKHIPAKTKFDLVFTSPPYYDLEIYSESEKDGSAFETYAKFMQWYKDIFAQCVERMADNRFLVVKVGEIRDKKTGAYRNFVGDNIRIFTELGLHYYNEIILVTAVGSLPIRAGKVFASYRKVGKTHQNILVFYKGNLKAIKDEYPDNIVFDIPSEEN